MGYRNYIASIDTEEYEQIKNFSKEEWYAYKGTQPENDYVGPYNIAEDYIYGLGKYVDQFDKGLFKPFFLNEDLHKEYNYEGELLVVEKKFMEAVIDRYFNKIQSYYKDMLAPFALTDKGRGSEFLNSTNIEYDYPDNKYMFDFSKITQEEQNALFKIIDHVKSMGREWGISFLQTKPYNLELGDSVTTSWKYEYAQFELIRIYKTFDWENKIMFYYGY